MKKIIVTILTAIITIIIARFSGMNAFAHGYASEWFKSDYDIYIGEVTAVDDIEVTSRNRNVEVLLQLLYTVSGRITFCLIIAAIIFIVVKKRGIKKSAQK